MSNLSDLLPAGASAKSITATDSGSGITSGKPVILETAGTVTQVLETTVSPSMPLGTVSNFETANSESYRSAADPHDSNRWAVVWTDDVGTKYVQLRIITRSGTTLTLSPETNVDTGGNASQPSVSFDKSTAGKLLVTFNNASNDGSARACTFSGSAGSESFTWGTALSPFTTEYLQGVQNASMINDLGGGKFFIIWSGTSKPTGRVLSLSGTTVTALDSDFIIDSNDVSSQAVSACINSTDGSTALVATVRNSNAYPYVSDVAISGVGVISTTSTAVVDNSQGYDGNFVGIQDIDQSRFLYAVEDGSDNYVYFFVGTLSGGTFSFGSRVASQSSSTVTGYFAVSNNISSPDTFITTWNTSGGSPQGIVGTITGSSLSFNTTTVLDSSYDADNFMGVSQQEDTSGHFIATYKDNSQYGLARLGLTGGASSNLTTSNFLGIADEAISASASGVIVVQGGTSAKLTSLTIGSNYYVQADGTFATSAGTPSVKAGLATSATTLLLSGDS